MAILQYQPMATRPDPLGHPTGRARCSSAEKQATRTGIARRAASLVPVLLQRSTRVGHDLDLRTPHDPDEDPDLFVARRELREGLDPGLALDLLIGLHRAETYLALTVECGWSMERYKAWQFATLGHRRRTDQ